MAWATSTVLAYAALAASVAGAGVSYYGAQQQASAAESASRYNAQVAEADAIAQAQALQIRSQQEQAQAESQAAFLAYQQQVQLNQGTALENQAVALRRDTEENIRRKREEDKRRLARIQAQFSDGGVQTSSGTPLAVLGETAGILELEVINLARDTEIQAQGLYYDAQLAKAGAASTGASAAFAQIRSNNAAFEGSTSRFVVDRGQAQASNILISGQNQASGIRVASTARAISSIGSAGTQFGSSFG